MSIENPEKYTIEYLEDRRGDTEWVEYVCDNYLEILEDIEPKDLAYACRLLIQPILDEFEGKQKTIESMGYMHKAINIARIGINSLSDKVEGYTIEENHMIHMDVKGDLFLALAVCMMNVNRPISAMENLDFAESSFMRIGRVMKDYADFANRMNVMYEHCRAKEAELYNKILYEIPMELRPLFANVANSYLTHAMNNLCEYGAEDAAMKYVDLQRDCEEDCLRYFDINTYFEDIPDINTDSITDDYQRWCQQTVRFLTIMNEVPHNSAKYAKDAISFPLEERYQWQMEDIIHTYDHCRRILYRMYKIPPEEFIDKDRDEDIECLMDCYARLYTLLDKTAKIIDALFPADSSRTDLKFYTVAESLANSSNPYLRAIYYICTDIFTDGISTVERTFDPRGNINGLVFKKGFIRNSIMHSTVKISKESEERGVYENVASLKPFELLVYTNWLSYDVREVLLTLQLAVGYSKRTV